MKAAYAVAAARRAAKLAWEKVMRKMDRSTVRRKSHEKAATGVAASTAMKALALALKTTPSSDQHTSLLETASSSTSDKYQSLDDQLTLPKEHHAHKTSPQPHATTKIVNQVVDESDSPIEFGMQLPHGVTNHQAQKDANEITEATVTEVRAQERQAAKEVSAAKAAIHRMQSKLKKDAEATKKDELQQAEKMVQLERDDLTTAERRADRLKHKARAESRRAKEEAETVSQDAMKFAQLQQRQIQEAGARKIKRVKADLESVTNGGTTKNLEWGAKLYKPKKIVLSDSKYAAMQVVKQAAKKKQEQLKQDAKDAKAKKEQEMQEIQAATDAKKLKAKEAKHKEIQDAKAAVKAAQKHLDAVRVDLPEGSK
jgi:hypothetical protein